MLTTIQTSLAAGELSPSLFGRVDLDKYKKGCSTLRNMFVSYRGGASSRAGVAYVGKCKQAASVNSNPPRDIPFQFNINQQYVLEFGDQYMRIKFRGAYVTETAITVSNVSSAALFTTSTSHGYTVGDWVFDTGNAGFSGLTWIIASTPAANTFTVTDLFGNPISVAMASTTGTVARIYTVVAPYAAVDLPFLKFAQSADTMTLCCVNQQTLTEYPPYDLVRSGNTSWAFNLIVFTSSISAPTNVTSVAHTSTTLSTWYSYVVTAVDRTTGDESIASKNTDVENNDIAVNAGSNTITWTAVANAEYYKIYAATPSFSVDVPVGSAYGFLGTAFGTQFTDTNIIPDLTITPPLHLNPFARGTITKINITAGGSSYTQGTVGYTVTTSTGSGFVGIPVIVSGAVVSFIVQNGGSGYANTDTITITDSATGTGATATLTVGAQTGTYPGVVSYFQQRRVYGYTLNKPNTYFMSQPGSFNNMDAAIPTVDSDAIVGAPWASQVNGIQFFQPMPSGLITLTGNGAWLLTGGNQTAITPADQNAAAQAYNGCHFQIPPIVSNYDILYVQAKGSIVRDLAYNFFTAVYTGSDTTILSNHLFNFHQLRQWCYAEEPFKIMWALRDDGILLSLTWLKEQEVYGWARHDTDGIFVGVCSVTEPPVDAVYVITKRFIIGQNQWAYYSERMDNRNWANVEDCFCVDSGLQYPMTYPNATLSPAAANGTSNISAVKITTGGAGYTAPVINAVDATGAGSGATFSVTLTGGVITGITVLTQGSNYTPGSTTMSISDSTGEDAILEPIITNNVIFTADTSVFNSGMVGSIIRIGNNNATPPFTAAIATNGGGQAIITSYTSGTQVTANILQEITNVIPNSPTSMPVPVSPNNWSVTAPVTKVSGLNHLEGMEIAILADGSVAANQIVTNGSITLDAPASAITIGLPYIAQVQSMYMDVPDREGGTVQGKRKNIYAVSVRVESSRGFQVGANQPDSSTQPNEAQPAWSNLNEVKLRNALIVPGEPIELATGDFYLEVTSQFETPGQAAVQQSYPLPLNLLALVSFYELGDFSE